MKLGGVTSAFQSLTTQLSRVDVSKMPAQLKEAFSSLFKMDFSALKSRKAAKIAVAATVLGVTAYGAVKAKRAFDDLVLKLAFSLQ